MHFVQLSSIRSKRLLPISLLLAMVLVVAVPHVQAVITCTTGQLDPKLADGTQDLEVTTGTCTVPAGTLKYKNVNIYRGGGLNFSDANIDFWASSILVEDGGSLTAGTRATPIGTNGGTVTIHLYGADSADHKSNSGITCKTGPTCNVPDKLWASNTMSKYPGGCTTASKVPGYDTAWMGGVDDCFYMYMPITYDGKDPNGYFGTKVLGVSYGGTLQLYGLKGAFYWAAEALPAWDTGLSWMRLGDDVAANSNSVILERPIVDDSIQKPHWEKGDKIVVTSTDYLPGHAEEMEIIAVDSTGTKLTVQQPGKPGSGFQYAHRGRKYPMGNVPDEIGPDADPNIPGSRGSIETRAAVGLLTRSIRIVSEGDTKDQTFEQAGATYSFGGHTMVRQGFKSFQVQGVEFYQLGQGGKVMHYPVHFHMTRKTPQPSGPTDPINGTFVKDSSIHDSMTRWITLHGAQGVILGRNVGYLSIGHGFYLEDGTEADNQIYANLGVMARGAVTNGQNPRNIPGILAAPDAPTGEGGDYVAFNSDAEHPAVFWITNAWNDIQYNMAAGAGTCGMCYWLVPAEASTMSRYEKWFGYAAEQVNNSSYQSTFQRAGVTPLKSFRGNACSSAMNSLITVANTASCAGVRAQGGDPQIPAIPNPLAPKMNDPLGDQYDYYPRIDPNGNRRATLCPDGVDCQAVPSCADGSPNSDNCMVSVINYYTTSFNWAQTNISAVWLRPQWYLFANSAITDVQNGGLTFITGGDYTRSSIITGYWALAHKDVFVGETQEDNEFASAAGPVKPKGTLQCAPRPGNGARPGGFCLIPQEGVSFPTNGFAMNQRFFNIYDGPAYESQNAYLDIKPTVLTDCINGGDCVAKGWIYGMQPGLPQDPNATTDPCYLPNAAIGWKQPNGFFYPPGFHSDQLFFRDVAIRHFVVEPLFVEGTYKDNKGAIQNRYCSSTTFAPNFTDVDRQTELTDDDGTLTGLVSGANTPFGPTISVNQDPFFNAPRDTRECASDLRTFPGDPLPPKGMQGTARTSPYEYVTSILYPDCGNACDQVQWQTDCSNQSCGGAFLWRLSKSLNDSDKPFIRMAGATIGQRSTLTVNHATYYLDTTATGNSSVFQGGHTYNMFFLYATAGLSQKYQMYVDRLGPGEEPEVHRLRANISGSPLKFTPDGDGTWPKDHSSYDSNSHILTITVDKGAFTNFADDLANAKKTMCQPATFCKWDEASGCGCNLSSKDPLYGECQNACTKWAGKDIDCPDGGCYGFSVKMPDKFVATGQGSTPPASQCVSKTDDGWSTPFSLFDNPNQPDDCKYTSVPVDKFCTSAPVKLGVPSQP